MRLQEVGDPEIATRINSFEMAFRMQTTAPEVMDITKEPKEILELYGAEPGKTSFANTCLLARRLVENGVRFVEIFHESWDQHGNLVERVEEELPGHRPGLCRPGQGPETPGHARRHAGDLGRRVRPDADGAGRHRRPRPSSELLHDVAGRRRRQAGARSARATTSASTPSRIASTSTTCTRRILHLLGFDHTKLTYRFQGRDFRLTDVHGKLVQEDAGVMER